MTRRRPLAALLLTLLTLLTPGCGSALGIALGGPRPYAGTALDAVVVARGPIHYQGGCGCPGSSDARPRSGVPGRLLGLADLPLTFLADTLLLPIVLPMWLGSRA